jgi:ribosome-associated protein
MSAMREVHTSRGSGEPIRLGQFLKLADAVELGSDVKLLLGEGSVRVNGEVETRRGRQLAPGDVVSVRGEQLVVH